MVAYKLNPHYCGETLDATQQDGFLKQEIIRMTPENERDAVIIEYSEYVGKLEGFSESHLWGNLTTKLINWQKLIVRRYSILSNIALKVLSILATSAASERNWSAFGFFYNKLRNRMLNQRVEKCVYLYWNMKILRKIKEKTNIDVMSELENDIEIENDSENDQFDNLFIEDFGANDLDSDNYFSNSDNNE